MHKVALAMPPRTPVLDVGIACDIFGVNRSDLAEPWYDFQVYGCSPSWLGGYFRTDAPTGLAELSSADTVIVPAGVDVNEAPPDELVDAVRRAYDSGARIVSICTGAFVLAAAGVLDGRQATTHWMHASTLASRYPAVRVDPNVLYVGDDRVFTSAGKMAGIDLCLHLVRLDHGTTVANSLARKLVMTPFRDGGQAQFIEGPAQDDHANEAVGRVMRFVAERIDEPLTIGDLARVAGMSTRNLSRRFKSCVGMVPVQWLLLQRVRRAQELLETTDQSVEMIATRTGMGTASTLRRHFSRAVGVPPDAYRRTFRGTADEEDGAVAPAVASPPAALPDPPATVSRRTAVIDDLRRMPAPTRPVAVG